MPHLRLGGHSANLSHPDRIPASAPNVRKALAHAFSVQAQLREASLDRDRTERAHRDAVAYEPHRRAEFIAAGIPIEAADDPVATAEQAKKDAALHLLTLDAAGPMVMRKLIDAIAEDKAAWMADELTASEAGLVRLATALDMLRQARRELGAAIGTLGMLTSHEVQLSPVIYHGGRERPNFTLPLDEAILQLEQGLAFAREDHQRLTPDKRRKGQKTPAADSKASEGVEGGELE